jgi:transcriptional regulator with XRE-family HTH domain
LPLERAFLEIENIHSGWFMNKMTMIKKQLTLYFSRFNNTKGDSVLIKKTIRYRFGEKLRSIRERKGLTLKEVAEMVSVSESLVSQIERNKVSPSMDILLTIADSLDIDFEYLFRDYKRNKQVEIVRAGEGDRIVQPGVIFHQLSMMPELDEDHAVEAFLLEVFPGNEKGDRVYGHTGKELGILLEGEGELIYGTSRYQLHAGDSVSFSSDNPHILRNTGKKILRAIWVISPPRKLFLK